MANSQWDWDNAMPEDYVPPENPEPELSAEEQIVAELMHQQYAPGVNELTWESLASSVKAHPDFSDALADLARGDCAAMREIVRATAVTMVRNQLEAQRGKHGHRPESLQ